MDMKILILEDDLDLGKALCRSLELSGFKVLWLRTIENACDKIESEDINLVLLDLSLPDGEGLLQLRKWRQSGLTLPVIIITARDHLDDLIISLEAGADDFMAKPFSVPELVARINAVYRRMVGYKTQLWEYGDVVIDPLAYTAKIKGDVLRLSRTEFSILSELTFSAGGVVPKRKLEAIISDGVESNSLDVHIHNLRKKVGKDIIKTIRGVGYSLNNK